MSDQPPETIGLLANRSMRTGPGSPLVRFIREFELYFRDVSRPKIYATEGTYRALLRYGLLHGYPHLHCVRAGYQGGIVTITDRVVSEDPADRIDKVIYLIDPRDPTSVFPESVALKRECVVTGKPFLATHGGACEWTALQWCNTLNHTGNETHPSVSDFFLPDDLLKALLPHVAQGLGNQTIALIAHDSKKKEMLRFAHEHFGFLEGFKTRLATGTTGTLLNGDIPERIRKDWDELEDAVEVCKASGKTPTTLLKRMQEREELDEACRQLRDDLGNRPQDGRAWVSPQPSGPRGGDVQIANAILNQQCQKVLFFEDPHVSREHEADIQLLERTSRVPELDVLCLHGYGPAAQWARCWEKSLQQRTANPITIIEAYRRVFGVELVLADRHFATPAKAESEYELWQRILEKAAWYIVGLVAQRARERFATGEKARVAVTWGYAMHEVIQTFAKVSNQLNKLDEKQPALSPSLAEQHYLNPKNIVALPMIGIIGTTEPQVEANENASRLAAFFGGKPRLLPHSAFAEKGRRDPSEFTLLWDELDLAIFTCERVKEAFSGRTTAPMPPRLFDQMKDAADGELGGLFLNYKGEEEVPDDYVRVGITHNQLKNVAQRGGAILITGVQEGRLKPVVSALRGQLVSVFVTNLCFAWGVLEALTKDTSR